MRILAPLVVLTALTLAPAQASAMVNDPGSGDCQQRAGLPPGYGWNGIEICSLDGSGGGSPGDGGFGIGPGGAPGVTAPPSRGKEDITIDVSLHPCLVNSRLCIPDRRGGKDGILPLGIDRDDPHQGPRPGGGATGGEVKQAKLTKEQCKKLGEQGAFLPEVTQKLKDLDKQIAVLEREARIGSLAYETLVDHITELVHRGLQARLRNYQRATFTQILNDALEVYSTGDRANQAMSDLIALDPKRQANLDETKALKRERGQVVAAGMREKEAALRACKATFR